MSDDIVARLRAVLHEDRSVELMNSEAANEIERLRLELKECEEVLESYRREASDRDTREARNDD